jgi:hypothetical protein
MKNKPPRHSWIEQDGFRVDKCEHCGTIRYWDDVYRRIMYKKEISEGVYGPALYWAPSCKFVLATDIPIKM